MSTIPPPSQAAIDAAMRVWQQTSDGHTSGDDDIAIIAQALDAYAQQQVQAERAEICELLEANRVNPEGQLNLTVMIKIIKGRVRR